MSSFFGNIINEMFRTLRRLTRDQQFALLMALVLVTGGLVGGGLVLTAKGGSDLGVMVGMGVAGSGIMASAVYMLRYLKSDRPSNSGSVIDSDYESEFNARMLQIEAALSSKRIVLTKDERRELLEQAKTSLPQDLLNEISVELEAKYAKSVTNSIHLKAINTAFDSARERLVKEIAALDRRDNLNLVLGSVTTMIGLIVLGVFVFTSPPNAEALALASHLVPRLALVLFIQIFGFFFLKLYRSSLEGIKYFQNEVTNIEIKYLAAVAAIMSGNEKALASIVSLLSKTEQNFILLKGQTTVEIEKTKIDHDQYKEILASFTDSLKPKNKKPKAAGD